MKADNNELLDAVASIASELFRFRQVFERATGKLEIDERAKYISQFAWFEKKVTKALQTANLRLVNVEGQMYDAGMAVSPININDFELDDELFVVQMIEPIVMNGDSVFKTGTVLLGRKDK